MKPTYFRSGEKQIPLPVFFPDATRAVLKTLDSLDIENTKTPGVLVNTYHLFLGLGKDILKMHGGVRPFMNWKGGVISDSGGFQLMSLVKANGNGKVNDEGIVFRPSKNKKVLFTPEKSIDFQMVIKPDMVVVLDDFTDPRASYSEAKESVERTIAWAKRSKAEFEKICKDRKLNKEQRPYLLGVVQGGEFLDLRADCTKRLVKIGFDGLGYGGWPMKADGSFNLEIPKVMADNAPESYMLYGLGVGKPDEVAKCAAMGFSIFDCVLPTRDARHGRLYVYTAETMETIDVTEEKFFRYYEPDKERHVRDINPVSTACDCLLCKNYTRSYLAHLFKIEDTTALRLATIHNLRFYSLLMEKIREQIWNK